MKKILTLLLCFVLLLSLCACGGKSAETPNQEQTPAVNEDPVVSEEPAANDQPAVSEDPEEDTTEDLVAMAKSYIDKPLADLIAVIGEPQSSDYAPSCLGDGEDGLLVYDGFVVYTYREGDSETVYDVE